jgi:DNA-binding NarL/FixJ family response regulator
LTAAFALGVDACVSEQDSSEQLLLALEAVRRAERYVAPDLLETAGGDSRPPPAALVDGEGRKSGAGDAPAASIRLTPRERDVLRLIAQGKTELEIGRELGVSPKTVHTHRTSIMSKLEVHNGIALVRRAIRLGLAEP